MNWQRTTRRFATVAVVAALSIGGVAMGTAGAVDPHRTIARGLAAPLQIDVSSRGVLVGQSFSGTLSVVGFDGSVTDLLHGESLDGVAWQRKGAALFTHTDFDAADAHGVAEAELRLRRTDGSVVTLADFRAHEEAENPDAGNEYGLQDLDPKCAKLLPPDQGLLPYNGILDSHPYALASIGGITFVADAGGNDILSVDTATGNIETVAVLPPQPTVVTAEVAEANGLPPCIVGKTFNFEPVPTDVEVARGSLYVTTLPGGPEDPSLGARGSVYKINRIDGQARRIATGFLGATNVAVSSYGRIYVAELFGNQISVVKKGHPVAVKEIRGPAALEWWNGRLYVGANPFGNGRIFSFKP